MTSEAGSMPRLAIALSLLDPASGTALQRWHFADKPLVRVGRLDENDVVVQDARVSRVHAELRLGGGGWELTSLGRNGVFINGSKVAAVALCEGTCFQLGPSGPVMRFGDAVDAAGTESSGRQSTVYQDAFLILDVDALSINEGRKQEELERIAQSDSFRQLVEQARRLKRRGPPRIEDGPLGPGRSSPGSPDGR
jgi:hypothetical protein